ncbi:hypothetical protein P0W64_13865 [Tsukamurella sp. 8F]|uniref:hypothetical protein n=1 Tax=unclassified Tsukamurella TaxID=2633480 RepID=UPI0023BA11F3|nr:MULTISPECIES: hypothetical protein [unclassified Tsukamurella]MDF0530659.1 hypothetical protein [Tsukamurella sp. 8J]MDF0587860.1 hypothetical protein [Tsukamurella sp. 8F]
MDPNVLLGNVYNRSANTGFLRIDGTVHGSKKWRAEELSGQWDFYNDPRYLYVRSKANPSASTSDFRVAVDGNVITGGDSLVVAGLELVGAGGHGYRQAAAAATEVVDCEIHEIGGAELANGVRYGNGVEAWMGSHGITVSHNEIHDVYDTACTIQGAQTADARAIVGADFHDNVIYDCMQAFEYWGTGPYTTTDDGFRDCSFVSNVCVGAGRSWSRGVRPDGDGLGVFLLAYSQDLPVDISVRDNVFVDAVDGYAYVNTNGGRFRTGYSSDCNTIALRAALQIQRQFPYRTSQAAEWTAHVAADRHSRWLTLPAGTMSTAAGLQFARRLRAGD